MENSDNSLKGVEKIDVEKLDEQSKEILLNKNKDLIKEVPKKTIKIMDIF